MKNAILSLAATASTVLAFPKFDGMPAGAAREALATLQTRAAAPPQGAGAQPSTPPPFSASAQYVSNQGAHAFVAPGPNDARGPCPGLNAMANHNYIPHNGVVTIQQFVSGTYAVFGMDSDLANFLSFFGAFVDGDGTGWSIEGVAHTGIGGSHNDYETDSSPLKGDLNQYGSNEKLIMSQFNTLYNMQPDASTANYNLEVMRAFRGSRYQESVAKNPYFVYGPFTGIEVSQAAFTFIYRFMSNKSAAAPEGILNKATLKSFMSITGPENNLTWTKGYERIPDNWYKRNDADLYSIEYFQEDILYFAETQPEILNVGCNEGAVNTFNVLNVGTMTNGAYTQKQVQANPLCFASEFAIAQAPSITGLSLSQLTPLISVMRNATAALNCKAIAAVNPSQLQACPGFGFYGGPTGPVAPGAIQS